MKIIEIAQDPAVKAALASLDEQLDQIVAEIIAVQQIPAPTFSEGERAAYIREKFSQLALTDIFENNLHNVYGRLPGKDSQAAPVVISAHSDTVFPASTDLTVRKNGRFIYGPGIADNSTGVTGLLQLAAVLKEHKLRPAADIWLAANVGEEGLGDLCGMRSLVERFGPEAQYIIVEGGLFGQIVHQGIGVRRFRVEINAPGGHSWGSFGSKSAVHEMGHLIAAIDRLDVPQVPRTTFNVGFVEGGTSINTIAQSASFLLDLRSEDAGALARLVGQVEQIIAERDGRHSEVTIVMKQIGYRPPGRLNRQHPMVQAAADSLSQVGCKEIEFVAASTDANIPLSKGLTAVCIGLARSGNAHRVDEYLDPAFLPAGLGQLLLLALAAAGYKPSPS